MTTTMRKATDDFSVALTHSTLEIALPKDTSVTPSYGALRVSPAVVYSDATSDLSVSALGDYIAALKDLQDRRSVEMTIAVAREILNNTWLNDWTELSPYAEIVRVQVALQRTLLTGHFHPDQLRTAFTALARAAIGNESIAQAAIRVGERNAREIRAAGPRDDE
jgi:hypothetical protein